MVTSRFYAKVDYVKMGDARFMVLIRITVQTIIRVLIVLILVNRGVASSAVGVVRVDI